MTQSKGVDLVDCLGITRRDVPPILHLPARLFLQIVRWADRREDSQGQCALTDYDGVENEEETDASITLSERWE